MKPKGQLAFLESRILQEHSELVLSQHINALKSESIKKDSFLVFEHNTKSFYYSLKKALIVSLAEYVASLNDNYLLSVILVEP